MPRLAIGVIGGQFRRHYWQLPAAEFSLNAFKYDARIVKQMQSVDLFLSVMMNNTERNVCHKVAWEFSLAIVYNCWTLTGAA